MLPLPPQNASLVLKQLPGPQLFTTFAANQGKWQMFLIRFNSPNCEQLLIPGDGHRHNERIRAGGGS